MCNNDNDLNLHLHDQMLGWLRYRVWCGHGVVWCGVVWCGVVWSGLDWPGLLHGLMLKLGLASSFFIEFSAVFAFSCFIVSETAWNWIYILINGSLI